MRLEEYEAKNATHNTSEKQSAYSVTGSKKTEKEDQLVACTRRPQVTKWTTTMYKY
jgi:hypothetical protein